MLLLLRRQLLVIVEQLLQKRHQQQRLFFHFHIGGFEPRQGEQLAHQAVHTRQFGFQPLQMLFLFLRLHLNQPHNRLHPRQGRAHFVRNVVQQMALFFHQLLQLFGHAVKLHRQQIKLVLAPSQLV